MSSVTAGTAVSFKVETLKAALVQHCKTLGSFHPLVIAQMEQLAVLLFEQGEYIRAERTCVRAIELQIHSTKSVSGICDMLTLYGMLLKKTGRHAAAKKTYAMLWAVQYKTHSEENPAAYASAELN